MFISCHKKFQQLELIYTDMPRPVNSQTTELQTHFGPASECEGAEKEDEVDEEEAEFGPVLAPHADDAGTTADPSHSAVSTLNSAHSQEHQRPHHQLGVQLGRLKQETNRCANTHIKHFRNRFLWRQPRKRW